MKFSFNYRYSDLPSLLAVAALYALLAEVVLRFFSPDGVVSVVWPSSGLALAALLIGGIKFWPAIFAGALIANISSGSPAEISFAISLGNTLEPIVCVLLLQHTRFNNNLIHPRDYAWLSVVGGIGCLVSALNGSLVLLFSNILPQQAFMGSLGNWWQGDFIGLLVVTPLILIWRRIPLGQLKPGQILEAVACFGLCFLIGQSIFLQWSYVELIGNFHSYWVFLFAAWAAVRFGRHGAVLMIAIIAIQALLGVVHMTGDLVANTQQQSLLNSWFFILSFAVVSLLLALVLFERKNAVEAMRLAAMVYKNSGDAIMITDENNRIIDTNPAFTSITGYTRNEAIDQNPSFLSSGKHDKTFFQSMWLELINTGEWQGEVWNKRKNGEVFPEWQTINTILNEDSSLYRRVSLFSDISKKKESEEIIWKQANFDALTNLPNRRMFLDRLEHEIAQSQRNNTQMALLFVDLDRFKDVNDALGHTKGDALLKQAALRLLECVRESDTVARFGGDEFTVLLNNLSPTLVVDSIIENLLQKLSEPFVLEDEVIYISSSIGIAVYPSDGITGEDLIKKADRAMYCAKENGRNRCCYFTPEMQESIHHRMQLTTDLRAAIKEQQFLVYYQPIVELATGKINKSEALIRWPHPSRGFVGPDEFIPIAEKTGLIIDIGNWVFNEVIQQVSAWRNQLNKDIQVSINASPVQFHNDQENKCPWTEALDNLNLPGQCIAVEITEGLLLDPTENVISKLNQLHDSGIEVSLDDFGTGFSSLAYLKKFDIDYLKIDKTFIENLSSDSDDMALCEAIIVMAHKLGLKVIAEGVETKEQYEILMNAGCDYGQGYLFSKPVPAEDFEQLLIHSQYNKQNVLAV